MQRETQVEIIERLLRLPDGAPGREATVPVASYTSPEQLAAEKRVLFRRYPLVVGHASELAEPGAYVAADAAGVPVAVVRGRDGELRAFLNVCRHRGCRVVPGPGGVARGFACPYHGWTYDLTGALIHVPGGAELFPSVVSAEPAGSAGSAGAAGAAGAAGIGGLGLVRLPVCERHGLIWAVLTPADGGGGLDVDAYLAGLGPDLAAYGLAGHHLYRRFSAERACNWKLILDAFLEGYHVRTLHRDTLYRFFGDRGVIFDVFGPHVRSVGARKTLDGVRDLPRERWDIRAVATPFYFVFPNTVLVVHPDYVSRISVFPRDLAKCVYVHDMLIPAPPDTDAARAHWERTGALIQHTVFEREDLAIAEDVQRGLASGADAAFRLGAIEYPIRVFHDAVAAALAAG